MEYVDGNFDFNSESILKYTWNQEQHLYIKLRVDTPEGYAEEELKVEVLELTPPTISIIIPSKGLKSASKHGLYFISRYST